MVNMSAKFDQVAHNGLLSIVFTILFRYICPLWPLTLTCDLQINRVISLTFVNKKHKTV